MKRSEQLERLLSELPDGALTTAESAEVRRAIADDSQTATTARQYERLRILLAGWRTLPADVDWQAFAQAASARVTGAAGGTAASAVETPAEGRGHTEETPAISRCHSEESDAVDRLIQRVAGEVPEVDWVALKLRISAAVQREALRTQHEAQVAPARWQPREGAGRYRVMTWAGRVGLPLAAAAAITLLVWMPRTGDHRTPGGADGLKSPIVLVSLEAPRSGGHVSVSFEGMPAGAASQAKIGVNFDETMAPAVREGPAGGMAIVVRSSAGGTGGGAAESFDDSLWY